MTDRSVAVSGEFEQMSSNSVEAVMTCDAGVSVVRR
jgi:hypothetical protein